MRKLFASRSDYVVSVVAPRSEAFAACEFLPCVRETCYCSGVRYYWRRCCRTETGARCCFACEYAGNYC